MYHMYIAMYGACMVGITLLHERTIYMRQSVCINGVVHLMTEEQIGKIEVVCSPEELEAFVLSVTRELGLPEPELYQDDTVYDNEYKMSPDMEKELNTLIEVQERMKKGLVLINEAQDTLLLVRKRLQSTKIERIPLSEYTALLKARTEWQDRVKYLWSKWFELQDSMGEVDSSLWAQYFQLAEEEINPYFTNGDPEDIDEQVNLFQDQNQVADTLRDSHLLEVNNPCGPHHNGSVDE